MSLKFNALLGLFPLVKAGNPLTSRQLDPSSKIGFVLQLPLPMRKESRVDSTEKTTYFIELHETDHLEGDSEEETCDLSMEEETLEYDVLEKESEAELEMDKGDVLSHLEKGVEVCEEETSLLEEMWKKMREHVIEKWKEKPRFYTSVIEGVMPFQDFLEREVPLVVNYEVLEEEGFQKKMREFSFVFEEEEGYLFAVFKGSRRSRSCLLEEMRQRWGSLSYKGAMGFKQFVFQVKELLSQGQLWDLRGSSVVLGFLERKTSRVYTAGWGKSLVLVGRKIEQQSRKWISLFRGKDEILVNVLKEGDLLLVLSEGCSCYLLEEEIFNQADGKETAYQLINEAIYAKRSPENVSVISITV